MICIVRTLRKLLTRCFLALNNLVYTTRTDISGISLNENFKHHPLLAAKVHTSDPPRGLPISQGNAALKLSVGPVNIYSPPVELHNTWHLPGKLSRKYDTFCFKVCKCIRVKCTSKILLISVWTVFYIFLNLSDLQFCCECKTHNFGTKTNF